MLIVSNESFRGARVQKIRKGMVFAVVEGEGKDARTFAKNEVYPQPPVVFTPEPGAYACARPPSGDPVWPVVRIESSSGGNVTVSDSTGQRRTLEARDLIPLAK